jgi:hypothetical protein
MASELLIASAGYHIGTLWIRDENMMITVHAITVANTTTIMTAKGTGGTGTLLAASGFSLPLISIIMTGTTGTGAAGAEEVKGAKGIKENTGDISTTEHPSTRALALFTIMGRDPEAGSGPFFP